MEYVNHESGFERHFYFPISKARLKAAAPFAA
jgi:hypothetical protein